MKTIDKNFIESIFSAKSVDEATNELFKEFGPCLRSEYMLEKERLIDLDWEDLGLVVTLSHGSLSQLYLSVNEQAAASFDGWLGDDVDSLSLEDDDVFDKSYPYDSFRMKYNFNEDKSLQSVVIIKK
jgi:hypothetical protein